MELMESNLNAHHMSLQYVLVCLSCNAECMTVGKPYRHRHKAQHTVKTGLESCSLSLSIATMICPCRQRDQGQSPTVSPDNSIALIVPTSICVRDTSWWKPEGADWENSHPVDPHHCPHAV